MDKITIIGTGRLGTALGCALSMTGYPIAALSDPDPASAEETRNLIGQGLILKDIARASEMADVIFITAPDEAINGCAHQMASSGAGWKKKIVLHCSGLLPARILLPLRQKGAETASCHPIQTFAEKKPAAGTFSGIYFGIEGSRLALDWARDMASRLGSKTVILKEGDKPLYHTACSTASNLMVALLEAAVSIAEKTGLDRQTALEMLFPLIKKTLHNVKKIGIEKALTGPLIREDISTVTSHLKALEPYPDLLHTYLALSSHGLDIAARLAPEHDTIKKWQHLVRDK
jgi:predicted short-subunit dehydrogenase-like oxidoreductase (DUF2520 family)